MSFPQLRTTAISCAACTIELTILRFIVKHLDETESRFLESDHGDKPIETEHISDASSGSREEARISFLRVE